MKVLGLDLSSKSGWAVIEKHSDSGNHLSDLGLIELGTPILGFGNYPWSYVAAAKKQAEAVAALVAKTLPDIIVIEETNLGKNRYSQKFLEFLHLTLLQTIPDGFKRQVVYISSSAWRSALMLSMSAADRKNNTKLSKAKKTAAQAGAKLDKKALGIKGRINKKHLAVRYVNATYDLQLKMKDNDIADAICLATAYLAGADTCNGQ